MPLTTSAIEGLPIIPPYLPGELIQAHFQRIADQNLIGVSEVSSLLKKFVATTYPHLEQHLVKPTLANLFGHPDEVVEKLRLTDYFVVPGNQASAKQVCPICLAEQMTAHLLLAESAYGICHLHRVANVYRCAACNRRLKWGCGDYFHCQCGFDLRLSPTICIDSDTCSLYLSCLHDQVLSAIHDIPDLQDHEKAGERLRSTVAYLMQDMEIQSLAAALLRESSVAVQREALHWTAIGMRIGHDSVKLNDVVTGIEARHIWGPAQSEWAQSCAQQLVDAISWEPLGFLASTSQSNAIAYRPASDVGSAIAAYDSDTSQLLERVLGNETCLSTFLRNELLFEVYRHKDLLSASDQQNSVRLDALIEATQNLRWIDGFCWDTQIPIATKDQTLSFIAAGAFHPPIALALEHWHVDQRDVAEVFQRIGARPWPELLRGSDDYFVLRFDQVFKPGIKPSDWFCLPLADIERRVIAFLRGDSLSLSSSRHSGNELALPLGFCAFLSTEDCAVYCDPQDFQLDSFSLLCETWQEVAVALINACKRAKDHMRGLTAWPQLASQVAEKYQLGDPWDTSHTRARFKANSLIARFHPYPYKSLEAALQTHSGRSDSKLKTSTRCRPANVTEELQVAVEGSPT